MKVFNLLLLNLFIVLSLNAQTPGKLTFSVKTAPTTMGFYEPNNVEAVWIVDESNKFVKTLLLVGYIRTEWLNLWDVSSQGNTVDAITTATYTNHGTRSCTWNGTDTEGNVVPDGTYKIKIQLTDDDFTGLNATYTFTKSGVLSILTPADIKPCFSEVSINWTPENTALHNIDISSPYTVYPSSGINTVFVNGFGINEMRIFNTSGKLILSTKQQKIDISKFSKGTYFLKIDSSKGTFIKKFMKF